MKWTLSRTRNGKSDDGNGAFSARIDYGGRWNSTSARTFDATTHKRGCEYERNHSSGFTVVVFQNAAEAMFAFDLARIKWNGVVLIVRFSARQRQ